MFQHALIMPAASAAIESSAASVSAAASPTSADSSVLTSDASRKASPQEVLDAPTTVVAPLSGRKRVLVFNQRMERDFLSKRYRALMLLAEPTSTEKTATETTASATDHAAVTTAVDDKSEATTKQQLTGKVVKDEAEFWCGATPVERALAACCYLPSTSDDDYYAEASTTDAGVPGAVRLDKMVPFCRLLVQECYDLDSRSLALAMLERTQEADEEDRQYQEEMAKELQESSSIIDDDPVRVKGNLKDDSPATTDAASSLSASLAVVSPSVATPSRLLHFLSVGGLKILSQWLVDATRVKTATGGGGTNAGQGTQTPTEQASPTGPILLPLLQFLRQIPFDRTYITQSKINKHIRKIAKQVDALVATASGDSSKEKLTDELTDPFTGGLSVVQVQTALQKLKEEWEAQAKQKVTVVTSSRPVNPLAALAELFSSRVAELQAYHANTATDQTHTEPPLWMATSSPSTTASNGNGAAKRKASAGGKQVAVRKERNEMLAKKERANERSAMMKKDLERAQQERRELLKQLRDRKKDEAAAEQQVHANRRSVRWKDGLGAFSRQRNRETLEEVFVFNDRVVAETNEKPSQDQAISDAVNKAETAPQAVESNANVEVPERAAMAPQSEQADVVDEDDDEDLFADDGSDHGLL